MKKTIVSYLTFCLLLSSAAQAGIFGAHRSCKVTKAYPKSEEMHLPVGKDGTIEYWAHDAGFNNWAGRITFGEEKYLFLVPWYDRSKNLDYRLKLNPLDAIADVIAIATDYDHPITPTPFNSRMYLMSNDGERTDATLYDMTCKSLN